MKTQVALSPDKEFVLVALNAAMVVGPLVLSLYSFRDYQGMMDVETAKQLTKELAAMHPGAKPKGPHNKPLRLSVGRERPSRCLTARQKKPMRSFIRHLVFFAVYMAGTAVSAVAADRGDTSQARADLQPSGEEGGAQASLRNQAYDLVRAQLGPDRYAWTNLLVHRQQDLVINLQMDGFIRKELTSRCLQGRWYEKDEALPDQGARFRQQDPSGLGNSRGKQLRLPRFDGCARGVQPPKREASVLYRRRSRSVYLSRLLAKHGSGQAQYGVHVSGSERDVEIYKGPAKEDRRRCLLVSLASKVEVFDQVAILFDDGDMSPPVAAIRVASECGDEGSRQGTRGMAIEGKAALSGTAGSDHAGIRRQNPDSARW